MLQRIATLIVCLVAAFVLAAPQGRAKPEGGYEGGANLSINGTPVAYIFNINYKDSSNPDQMTVTGRATATTPGSLPIEIRGTYFVKTRKTRAFGEIRGREKGYNINLDGFRMPANEKMLFRCTVKDLARDLDSVEEFYMVPGPDVGEGAHVEIALFPNKAVIGQNITGIAMVDVTNADGPVKLTVTGGISYIAGGLQMRKSSPNIVRISLPGNGKHKIDLASMGINFPAGLDEPMLVLQAKSSVDLASQTIRLEYDPPSGSLTLDQFTCFAPQSVPLGETFSMAPSYIVHNRTNKPVEVTIAERAWIAKKGEARTEITPEHSWLAKVSPNGKEWKNTETVGPFSFKPTSPGTYRVDYEIVGPGVTPVKGFIEFEVTVKGGATPVIKKGDIRGTIKLDKSPIEVQEPSMLTLGYTLSGRPNAEVEEVVEMIGPSGAVVSTSRRKRTIEDGAQAVKKWIVNATEKGTYRIRARITSPDSNPLETETVLTVNAKSTTATNETRPTTPPKAQGTYGLVKKVVGNLPDSGVGPYGTWTGSIGEGACSMVWTATRDYQGTFNWSSTFVAPPPVLKQGDIIELTCSATASRSSENQPSSGIGAKWYVEGADVMEATSAFAGPASDGKFYPSSKGKTRFKVGSGGKIVLHANNGIAYGVNGNMNSCSYTYQWNSPPTVVTPKTTDDDKPIVNTRTGLTPLTPDDPEEDTGKLRAYLDTTSISLRPGDMGQIVSVRISGFRTKTEDRVEVIFPEKTDNWASLPGGIVVTGGDGSYWPPNMGRPEHADGYFFRARSNAQPGTKTVTIIVRQRKAGEVRLTLTVNVSGKGSTGPTNPPPTGTNWAGTWSSNLDTMILAQQGDDVTGKFGVDEYRFVGKAKGKVVTFKIYDGKDEFGGGTLTMSDDGASFKGEITVAGNDKIEWTGKRK